MKLYKLCLTLLLCVLSAAVSAQDGAEVNVGEINLPNMRWGYQQANFEVTNTTDYLKFITVVNTISFSESNLTPSRMTKTNYVLGPLESKILTPRIYVPGNYGKATITVALYDVVDTSDILLPMQKFFEQPIYMQYHMPQAMVPYLTTPITLPPMVDAHENWDNELSRALLVMLRDGKSIGEIAFMAEADTAVVRSEADQLVVVTALEKKGEDQYEPTFAVILEKEAKAFEPMVERASDTLVALVKRNLPVYRAMIDSMVKVGRINADTNDFLNPGAILYREYPAIVGLFFWDLLGKQFVSGARSLQIFEGTDYCNAYTPFFMYAVQGTAELHGRHFYSRVMDNAATVDFADFIPDVQCEEGYVQKAKMRQPVSWKYLREENFEGFLFRSSLVDPVFRSLLAGNEKFADKLKTEFEAKVRQQGFKNFANGPKYWFWNWVVTKATDKLVKDGTLTRRGNGHYQFQEM